MKSRPFAMCSCGLASFAILLHFDDPCFVPIHTTWTETAIGGCRTALLVVYQDRFKALTDRLQETIKQPGEWYGLITH